MKVDAIKTRLFKTGENLVDFIIEHIPAVKEKSIVVITSKIAAEAEGRIVPYRSTDKEEIKKQKIELIKQESELAIHTPYTWLTLKDGLVMASAGIDESNSAGDYFILLPEDSFQVAIDVRDRLKKYYDVKDLGVVVTDSRVMPLRKGTLGVAYGYAGIEPLRDYRGTKDLYGREFKVSRLNIPDGLASAAVVLMGEGKEQTPLAVIENFPAVFTNEPPDRDELKIDLKDDLYGPLFKGLK